MMTHTLAPTPFNFGIAGRFHLVPLLLFLAVMLPGCSQEQPDYFQGYIEGEYLQVASPIAGRLKSLAVSRGMRVAEGTPLFVLDQNPETAAVSEAEQGVLRAQNRLADLTKGLRPTEIAAIKAKRRQARAAYDLAKIEFERREKLVAKKAAAREALDQSRTDMERNAAAIAELTAELQTARMGARADEIKAARTDVQAARDRTDQARWRLNQKTQTAPAAGLIFDTFYVSGEFVPVATPVVSILPPGNIKVRFFVPEKMVGALTMEQRVSVSFDGAKKTYHGLVSYISPQAEYTPPVIYSRETRSHLVYMIEARIDENEAAELHPGQPVEVRPVTTHD